MEIRSSQYPRKEAFDSRVVSYLRYVIGWATFGAVLALSSAIMSRIEWVVPFGRPVEDMFSLTHSGTTTALSSS